MKVKSKGFIGLIFSVLIILGTLILIVPSGTLTAKAATSSSNVCTIQGRVESTGGSLSSVDVTENFTVTMESTYASGTSTLGQNAKLNWTYVKFKVSVTKILFHKSFWLEKDGENFFSETFSGKDSLTFYSGSLPDGNYVMYYQFGVQKGITQYPSLNYVFQFSIDTTAPKCSLTADGQTISSGSYTNKAVSFSANDINFQKLYYKSPSASSFSSTTNTSYLVNATSANSGWWEFYAADSLGNTSEKVKVYIDCVAPTMSCSSGVSFGGTTGSTFTVSATDAAGTAKLYVKFESEEWFTNGSSYTVPATERNGRYYFYAEDNLGNKTDTKWVVLSTDEPVGRMMESTSDNGISFTWDSDYWSATLDGRTYNKGTWITAEGNHTLILNNNAGKTKTYNFSIDHYYVQVSQTAATCKQGGKVRYECRQCGNVRDEVLYAKGHQYGVQNIPASCIAQGQNIYTCSVCGDTYTEDSGIPSGHSFTSVIKSAATCTQGGIRQNTCELCGEVTETRIAAQGHSYEITNMQTANGNTSRTYTCSTCGDQYTQELGNQYEQVASYVEYLFDQYSPYMFWVLLATAGLWSIAIGISIIIAVRNDEKAKAKKMLVNYLIGLVVIAVIVVACPYLIRGIATLVG